ncbi:hypothetical protein CCACVL1_05923 [Corchorus capsularis]|uniref:Uncharacterized protein n=1 Tax=Corchorus capsularis TaxID=210143 RepID=A0A1R3JIB5_COCAP|nr:hypothetical protein CCACVL1_05923 [Corchorus capsularis]
MCAKEKARKLGVPTYTTARESQKQEFLLKWIFSDPRDVYSTKKPAR